MLNSWCLQPSQPQRVISGLMTERRMTTCLKRWRSVAGGFCLQINLFYVIKVSHLIFCHFPCFCTVQHAVIITGWVYYLLVVHSQVSMQYWVVVFVCVCFWRFFTVFLTLLCSLPRAISQQLQLLRHKLPLWPHRQPQAQRWKKNMMKHDCR